MKLVVDGYALNLGMLLGLFWFCVGVVCGRLEAAAEKGHHA